MRSCTSLRTDTFRYLQIERCLNFVQMSYLSPTSFSRIHFSISTINFVRGRTITTPHRDMQRGCPAPVLCGSFSPTWVSFSRVVQLCNFQYGSFPQFQLEVDYERFLLNTANHSNSVDTYH